MTSSVLIKYFGVRSGQNADDVLFDTFKNEDTGLLPVGKFLEALKKSGIRVNDLRIKEIISNLNRFYEQPMVQNGQAQETNLDRDTFKQVIAPNVVLISRAFRNQFVIPDFQVFNKDIEVLYKNAKRNTSGVVASYIPQLAKASADSWGVSVCTVDGQRSSFGDVTCPFTMQSCGRALTYGMALEKLGPAEVHKYVSTVTSGRNCNDLVLDANMKPYNPMINAGAILICSLLKSLNKTHSENLDDVKAFFSRMAGREHLSFNKAVYLSEKRVADRNYAIGHYMQGYNCFPDNTNLSECMDFYFQCCSLEANCDTMSIIAATLANGGICPTTGEQVLQPDSVRNVLSLMHSCGMYDYSGEFAFKVGLPAKSGVSGALLIVVPDIMGICTWSPPLDSLGNSCRGLQFCEEFIQRFRFHKYYNSEHMRQKDPLCDIVSLLFTAASGDLGALRRRYISGMDMTLPDYNGRTALHLAAAEGHLSCVDFLLAQCGVPHDPRDRWGRSPLNEAETLGHTAVVSYLKEIERSLNLKKKQSHVFDRFLTVGASEVLNTIATASRRLTDAWNLKKEDTYL